MAVTDAWTDPSEGGSLDCDAGSTLTDAKYDGICSDLLHLGGATGTRSKNRLVQCPVCAVSGTSAAFYGTLAPFPACTAADGQSNSFYGFLTVPQDFGSLTTIGAIVIPDGTGNCYQRLQLQYGKWGTSAATAEGRSQHNPGAEAYAAVGVAQADVHVFAAASGSYSAIAAGDVVGIRWDRDASNASDTVNATCYVIGFFLEYQTA